MKKKKRFHTIRIRDYFQGLCYMTECRFKDLPAPLPWIEPSINMLYLESVLSYVLGNDFCSIISMSALLEHVLRLALLDRNNTGLTRSLSLEQLDGINSISVAIKKAISEGIIDTKDKAWWDSIAKIIRNKSAHYIIPKLIKDFTKQKYDEGQGDREKYSPVYYRLTNDKGEPKTPFSYDWGMFFHKVGYFIAKAYIVDGTFYLKKVIKTTDWKPDRSYWASQEDEYNFFFSYNWNIAEMIESLDSGNERPKSDGPKAAE